MQMLCPTETHPADGVIDTSPTTAPTAAPHAVRAGSFPETAEMPPR